MSRPLHLRSRGNSGLASAQREDAKIYQPVFLRTRKLRVTHAVLFGFNQVDETNERHGEVSFFLFSFAILAELQYLISDL